MAESPAAVRRPLPGGAVSTPSCCGWCVRKGCWIGASATTGHGSPSPWRCSRLGWAVFVWLGPSWWQLVVAAFLAVVFVQLGFLGHDAGHRQVFRSGAPQRPAGPALREPADRAELQLVDREAQPPPRQPQPRRPRPGHRCRWGRVHQGAGPCPAQPDRALGRPPPGRPVLPDVAVRGRSLCTSPASGPCAHVRQATPGGSSRCCWAPMSSATSRRCSSSCRPRRRWRSSRSSRACSASTWAVPSRLPTRGCPCWVPVTSWTSSAARCSPRATSAADAGSTWPWAA